MRISQYPYAGTRNETYTVDMRAAASAATPDTAMVVLANLLPVPPIVIVMLLWEVELPGRNRGSGLARAGRSHVACGSGRVGMVDDGPMRR